MDELEFRMESSRYKSMQKGGTHGFFQNAVMKLYRIFTFVPLLLYRSSKTVCETAGCASNEIESSRLSLAEV